MMSCWDGSDAEGPLPVVMSKSGCHSFRTLPHAAIGIGKAVEYQAGHAIGLMSVGMVKRS